MHTSRYRGRWLFDLYVVCNLLTPSRVAWPQYHLLPPKATLVAKTQVWYLQHGATYHWLTNRRLLFFRDCRWQPMEGIRVDKNRFLFKGSLGRPYGGTAVSYDVTSGKQTNLTGLSSWFQKPSNGINAIDVSPDGTWLQMSGSLLVSLDGLRHVVVPSDSGWTAGGHTLYQVNDCSETAPDNRYAYCVYIFSAETPHQIKTLRFITHSPLTRPSAQVYITAEPIRSAGPILSPVQTLTQDNRFVTTTWNLPLRRMLKEDPTTTEIIEVGAGPNRQPLHRYQVHLPEKKPLVAMLISPRADRIAWLFGDWPEGTLPQKSDQLSTVSIWISDLEGRRMHKLGQLPVLAETVLHDNDLRWQISHIQWLPDGRRLSFVYKDALWTIPAN